MKKFLGIVVALFVLISMMGVPQAGFAGEETEGMLRLDDVVVSATGKMKVLDTPASISVITAKELEEQGITNVGEAIVQVPGVYDDGASTCYLSIRERGVPP